MLGRLKQLKKILTVKNLALYPLFPPFSVVSLLLRDTDLRLEQKHHAASALETSAQPSARTNGLS
jgi:hypothetical protein